MVSQISKVYPGQGSTGIGNVPAYLSKCDSSECCLEGLSKSSLVKLCGAKVSREGGSVGKVMWTGR